MKYSILLLISLILPLNFVRSENRIIDHNSPKYFEKIPDEFITKSIQTKTMFRHASVGTTIDGGLNCLQGTKSNCKQYPQYKYDRRNWFFQARGNNGWYGKIDDFVQQVDAQAADYDVFAFKYCYLDGLDQVDEPCGKYPSNPQKVAKAWEYLRDNMTALESEYPSKIFVWWTIPLTQVGQNCTEEMNKLIRDYCAENNRWLFDIADIESHDTLDFPVVNANGWQKAYKPYCGEQKPDAQACHPNDLGSSLLAKAYWVLIAQIAGWNPDGNCIKDDEMPFYIIFNDNSIELPDLKANDIVEIYSITGIKLIDSLGKKEIDTSRLSRGMYFLKINNKVYKFTKI